MMNFEKIISIAPSTIVQLLEDCKNTLQSPKWHPEGNVFNHIKIVYERSMESEDMDLLITALFHDLGKVKTTELNKKGDWSAYGHEYVSAKIVEEHKNWITGMGANWKNVLFLVKEHMRIKYLDNMRKTKREELLSHPLIEKLNKFTTYDDMSAYK